MTQVLGSGNVQREQLLPGGIGSVGSRRGHPGLLQGCIQVLLALPGAGMGTVSSPCL